MTNNSLVEAILEREAAETRLCTDIYERRLAEYERERRAWVRRYVR